MNVYDRFLHLAEDANERASTEELVQVSIKMKADYVLLINSFAEHLKISRNQLINSLIKGALPDALQAFYKNDDHNPLDQMTFDSFMEKVLAGEYLK